MSAPGPDPAEPGPAAPEPAEPTAGFSFGPLLHTLGDPAAPLGELTDAHLTIIR